uniref:Ribonuclease A-domain domain-containing protein n=1 Tax=Amphilophus citrinellus TaxID=61819 RepID=A0A3Q0RG26_AMPCI
MDICVFLPQGIMRVQCVCLLLLLLSAPALSQSYKDFKRKHILPQKGSHNCNNMMININGRNECKSLNNFINTQVTLIVALCQFNKNGWITHKCDVIDCIMISSKPCRYQNLTLRKNKTIKCENGLPVHLQNRGRLRQ